MPLNADAVIEALNTATEETQISPMRGGQVVTLPDVGEVWMTGDLHDHRRNFDKLIRAADLGHHPQRHLVLHELLHGDHYDASGAEDSYISLVRAAELKCDFPNQVHFLLANHDLSQIHGEGISKSGVNVCEAFNKAVKRDFPDHRGMVQAAITEFLLSFPLAVRCPAAGLFFCHSLPADDLVDAFDFTVFDRALTSPDYAKRKGPVYQLIWGRNFSPTTVATFADKVGARILVTGHQPQDTGYAANGDRHLILASDHNQGVFLPIHLETTQTMSHLCSRIKKFVAIEL